MTRASCRATSAADASSWAPPLLPFPPPSSAALDSSASSVPPRVASAAHPRWRCQDHEAGSQHKHVYGTRSNPEPFRKGQTALVPNTLACMGVAVSFFVSNASKQSVTDCSDQQQTMEHICTDILPKSGCCCKKLGTSMYNPENTNTTLM